MKAKLQQFLKNPLYVGIAAGVVGFFYLGKSSGSMRWGVRWALLAASGALPPCPSCTI